MLKMFDFRCSACGKRFEDLVEPDIAPPPCPRCASGATSRLAAAARVIGPTFSTEEAMSRATGRPIRGYRDMEAFDREQGELGLVRRDYDSPEVRIADEEAEDEDRTRDRLKLEGDDKALERHDMAMTARGLGHWTDRDWKEYQDDRDSVDPTTALDAIHSESRAAGLPDWLGPGDARPGV